MEIPEGFKSLADAYNGARNIPINIIGVVVDTMPPKPTRTGENMMTIKLLDHKLRDSLVSSQGLIVRLFRKVGTPLPDIRNVGDVVLFRGIKMVEFNGTLLALSNMPIPIVVFRGSSIPEPAFSIAYQDKNRIEMSGLPIHVEKVSLLEQKYAIDLHQELNSTIKDVSDAAQRRGAQHGVGGHVAPQVPVNYRSSTFGGIKYRLIRDVGNMQFADICGQVVKMFTNQWGCELYLTDYTENKLMWHYSDPKEIEAEEDRDGDRYSYLSRPKIDFPGPYGWLTLKVNVKYPHAQAIDSLSLGDFVLLRNVKCKVNVTGAKLEGDMWPDELNPEKINVVKIHTHNGQPPEVDQLLQRKEKYWEARARKHPELAPPQKTEAGVPESRKAKKKRKKNAARRKEAEEAPEEESIEKKLTAPGVKDPALNPHVRCGHTDTPVLSLRKILDPDNIRHTVKPPDREVFTIPFINARYRSRVRVVDYEPKPLEDFTYLAMPEDDKSVYSADMEWSESSPRWEWYFSLLLEDASAVNPKNEEARTKQWVHVSHLDAQFMFGNDVPDPADLRNDPLTLAKMKEKLMILWGNLEEKSPEEDLVNRPFECCLTEYGVELDDDDPEKESSLFGYKRMFRIFGTTIL